MRKIVPVIIIVLALVAGYFFYTKSKGGVVSEVGKVSSGVKTLGELISSGVPQKCSVSETDESGSKTEGTTYVASGKVRADFTSTTSGKATVSHMISDGKTSYIWSDDSKDGIKTTIQPGASPSSVPTTETTSQTSSSTGTDLSQKGNYNCSAWLPDSSVFSPPGDIKFSDFSEMMKVTTPTSPASGSSSSQCAYCDSLSGSEKDQCLSALNCK